jgi:hypothetical protein
MKTGRKQKYIELSPSRSAFYSAANMTKSKTCMAVHIRGLVENCPPPLEKTIFTIFGMPLSIILWIFGNVLGHHLPILSRLMVG